MTTDFGIVNASEGLVLPLRLSGGHAKDLTTTLVQVLVASGATSEELLSIYTPAPVLWEIPSIYSPSLMTTPLTASMSQFKTKSVGDLYATYKKVVDIVQVEGFGNDALEILEEFFGEKARHPLYFSRTKASPEAAAIFGMEWACLLQNVANKAVFQADHAFVRFAADFFTPSMGVVEGRCEGSPKVTAEFMQESLSRPRGYIDFGTFDILDRVNLWMVKNLDLLEEPEKLLRALCLVKLAQNPRVTSSFERSIRNLPQPEVIEPTLKMLAYNDEALDVIRDIWYDHDTPNRDKFLALHAKLVPVYLDDGQFKDMFNHMPSKDGRITFRIEQDINRGLDKFITLFLQTRRAIAEGKRIVMKE